MSNINYMENERVRSYYDKWTVTPLLTQQYAEYFYKFVKACLEVDKRPSIEYLKSALYDSFHDTYDPENYVEFDSEVIEVFERCRDFANTTLP